MDADGGIGESEMLGDALDDLADLVSQAVRLGDAGDRRIAVPGTQQRRELTEAVQTLVVNFDDQDFFVAVEDVLLKPREGEGVGVGHSLRIRGTPQITNEGI